MKKIICLILALLLPASLALTALALEQDGSFYVTDETGYLSRDTVEQVISVGEELEEKYQGYIAVAFIDYFGDTYADEYTVSLFNSWSLSDNAMLLCVSPKEGRGGMTVGSSLTDVFTEKDINSYLDKYFWKEFDKGNYDKAVTTLVDKLADWYRGYYGPMSSGAPQSGGGSASLFAGLGILGVILGFIFRNITVILICVLIIVLIIQSDRRRYRGYYTSMGMPIPRYRPWYVFSSRPYKRYRAPRPPRDPPPPPGGGYRFDPPSRRPSPRPPSHHSTGGHSTGSFGGRSGGGSFGGHSGGGRSGGSFGGRR